jgi:hypothetical protein
MSMTKNIRALLDEVGLFITTPHINPGGYGYIWRGRPWLGPFASEYDALKAAFDEAIQIMNTERSYSRSDDGIWWKWDNGRQYIGELEQEKESEVQP